MFALAAIAGMLLLLERSTVAGYAGAGAVFLVAGSSVEFWWPALSLGLAVWGFEVQWNGYAQLNITVPLHLIPQVPQESQERLTTLLGASNYTTHVAPGVWHSSMEADGRSQTFRARPPNGVWPR